MSLLRLFLVATACTIAISVSGQEPNPYPNAKPGSPLNDPSFFPIAVWLQSAANAQRFKAAGINTYVGLWRGPTEVQLATLKTAGMKVICSQNSFALEHLDDPSILAWMHGDEPDNAQSKGQGQGYGPPILPEVIVRDYKRIKEADPSRPVLLNLGQGVAWDNYIGRGVRRNHPEDYPEYLKGCDIASFDIYPAVHEDKEIAGKLEYVPRGVKRLMDWTEGKKVVWNCIECTRISNVKTKPTPAQVRSEVWMSLIHGSRGIIYFLHQFKPEFREAALLDDPEMLKEVTHINTQITQLASVLNSPSIEGEVTVSSDPGTISIATMVKKADKELFVLAAAMSNSPSHVKFHSNRGPTSVEVFGENRTLSARAGTWEEDLEPYGVRIYHLRF